MRFLSFLRDDVILKQVPLPVQLNQELVIDIDELLRELGVLAESEEVAVTYEVG